MMTMMMVENESEALMLLTEIASVDSRLHQILHLFVLKSGVWYPSVQKVGYRYP